jgi:hypothetical protein
LYAHLYLHTDYVGWLLLRKIRNLIHLNSEAVACTVVRGPDILLLFIPPLEVLPTYEHNTANQRTHL